MAKGMTINEELWALSELIQWIWRGGIRNKENGDVYIGATTYSIERRQFDHVKRADSESRNRFQEAISTYGVDVFT